MKQPTLAERDMAHVWHPYTQHQLAYPPTPIESANGIYLFTSDGRKIIDGISSWWVTLHGHAHPVIAAAIAEQAGKLEQVIFAGFTHEPAVALAESLVKIAPSGLERVFYSDNGSTAVEVAIKMALQYWRNMGSERKLVVALDNAYHGDTFGAMSVSAPGVFTAPFAQHLFDVARLPDPVVGDATVSAFRDLLRKRGDEIAAIIVEPLLLGAGGMRMYNADVLRELRTVAAAADVLFIADEVLTGFGRTGPLFACEHADISPDIICLSKGVTGGFIPLGVTMASQRVYEAFLSNDRTRTLFHGHSFTANPLACAAALASSSLLDNECAERRRTIERVHHDCVANLSARFELVREARVLGTVAAFEMAGEAGYLSGASSELARSCMERGLLIRPLGNVVYLLPPYCITENELRGAYELIEGALTELVPR